MLAIQLYIGELETQSNESSEKNKPTTTKQTQKSFDIFVGIVLFGDRCVTHGKTDQHKSRLPPTCKAADATKLNQFVGSQRISKTDANYYSLAKCAYAAKRINGSVYFFPIFECSTQYGTEKQSIKPCIDKYERMSEAKQRTQAAEKCARYNYI